MMFFWICCCHSPHVARSHRSEPKGSKGQSPPTYLSFCPCLFTAFTVIDEPPIGVRTGTNVLENTHSSQSYRQGFYGNSLSCHCVWTPIWYEHTCMYTHPAMTQTCTQTNMCAAFFLHSKSNYGPTLKRRGRWKMFRFSVLIGRNASPCLFMVKLCIWWCRRVSL